MSMIAPSAAMPKRVATAAHQGRPRQGPAIGRSSHRTRWVVPGLSARGSRVAVTVSHRIGSRSPWLGRSDRCVASAPHGGEVGVLSTVADMRLLHTSDWHIGRTFHGVDLLAEQEWVLDHLVELVATERIDVVVVAGDV